MILFCPIILSVIDVIRIVLFFLGPSVLDVINTLLRHLRLSIGRKVDDEAQRIKETKFEENIINTIGIVC